MMIFTDSNLHHLKRTLAFVVSQSQENRPLEGKPGGLAAYLAVSEKMLIDLVNGGQPAQTSAGCLEHAALRCMFRQARQELVKRNMLSNSEKASMDTMAAPLELDKTLITPEIWQKIEHQVETTGGIVGSDGTIFGFNTYEGLDINWLTSGYYYAGLMLGFIKKAGFVAQTNTAGIPVTSDKIKIAIMGDWGTGPYQNADGVQPSALVMAGIVKQKPDFTIHLGDVYYSGTAAGVSTLPDEELNNLVNVWPFPKNRGFTLNSNHEMYSGGHGLFEVALTNPAFGLQNGASYFALAHKNWVILGLDSAYYDKSELFMDGALTDPNQLNFIKGINTAGKKVIVLTHHSALTDNGKTRMSLWGDVHNALGGKDPDFWYWGHVHNAIAYSSQANVGATIARCLGHGALPFTKAPELYQGDGSKNAEIAYYAGQELPVQPHNGQIQLAKNGYAILTLTPDTLTEVFYDLNGNAVWSPPPYNFV